MPRRRSAIIRLGQINTSQKRIAAAERARQALELRKAGVQYADIAITLKFASASGAYRAVARALARLTAEPAAELRKMEVLRLDRMLQAIWDQVVKGNQGAIDRALRIGERRSKLLGLDTPQKIQEAVSDELDINQLSDGELGSLLAWLRSHPESTGGRAEGAAGTPSEQAAINRGEPVDPE
jgi:hypothetical protein